MTPPLVVLIVGGYGTFGGRTARLLARRGDVALIVAGRSRDRAAAFSRALAAEPGNDPRAQISAVAFDRNAPQDDLARLFRNHHIDLVVDASGPFQDYDAFRLVSACIAARVDYIDLADASAFVAGIPAFDAAAQAAGVFVLAGASSFPVLTAAAVRAMSRDLATIHSVSGGIAPSPHAKVGRNVIAAVLTYAGQPIRRYQDGAPIVEPGILKGRRKTIAVAGRDPLPRTRFTLFDVPDLLVLPAAGLGRSVWMGAGPTPAVLHRALNACSWLVSKKVVPSLRPMAGLVHAIISNVRWGRHRGGMFVTIRGETASPDSRAVQRTWSMIADGDDGPDIPTMAVVGLVARIQAGQIPAPGARSAADALELDDYVRIFATRVIATAITEDRSLYDATLGPDIARLPRCIVAMHAPHADRAIGTATVERGRGPLARIAATVLGLPRSGAGIPVTVVFDRDTEDGIEIWTRHFGRRAMRSTQERGPADPLTGRPTILERFGPITVVLRCEADDATLRLTPIAWRLFGLAMPKGLMPGGYGLERDVDGTFSFDVEMSHPLIGVIARYTGVLTPASTA